MSSCDSGAWELALVVLAEVGETIKADAISFDSAMSACEKAEGWPQAVGLLLELHGASLKKDAVTCSALTSGCVKAGKWISALQLFGELCVHSVRCDSFVYTGAMKALEIAGHWNGALSAFDELRHSLRADLVSRNAAISACSAEWQLAVLLLEDAPFASQNSDEIAFNTVVSACAKGERSLRPVGKCGVSKHSGLTNDIRSIRSELFPQKENHIIDRRWTLCHAEDPRIMLRRFVSHLRAAQKEHSSSQKGILRASHALLGPRPFLASIKKVCHVSNHAR